MCFSATNVSSIHTYLGNPEINFISHDNGALTVTIDTKRLRLRSVEEEDLNAYASLFGDREVMEKFATGQTKTKEEVWKSINTWVQRWRENDPYSGLAAFEKGTNKFVGHAVLGHGDAAGEAEAAGLVMKEFWGKGLGTEAAIAIVKVYARATVKEGFTLKGKPLEKIRATARPENAASVKILENLNMRKTGIERKYDALRYRFAIDLSNITQKV
jgi:RimJ/RimL family protein N-acetyltransferase